MGGVGLIWGLAIALVIFAGALYAWIGVRRDARRFPAPGRMIDLGNGGRLHADIRGAGSPPVVFEAGIAATSLSWRLVQAEAAKFTQTVSYDRAGLGWSGPCSSCDLARIVDDLRAMLDRANVAQPRIVAGHSFGGLIALAYAARFPEEVAGLVLVDPASASEWAAPTPSQRAMLARGIFLSRVGEILARLGIVRFTLNLAAGGSRVAPKLIARASSGRGGSDFIERMLGEVRKLPRDAWPGVQAHWSDPKCFRAMARTLQALPESGAAMVDAAAKIEAPMVVLSAGNASAAQRADHERLVRDAPHARLEIVEDSGHWILLDRPDAVIRAIRSIMK